jgi:peptide/nickel transport system ATP-binding protein
MIFQDPMTSLNPLMKIGEQIAEPLRIHLGMSGSVAAETAEKLLNDVRIPEAARRLKQYPHEMSGGMRQRVMIAIAMACGPTVILADEPTTALDVTVQAQILDLLGEQRRERNMSLILVTHDLGVVAGHTDQIAVMYGGRLVEKAPTADLFANMKMPYTEALMESIPKLADRSHTRLQAIAGRPPDLVNPPKGCRFAPRCAYVRDKCLTEEPTLTPTETNPAHTYRCWYPVGSPEYREKRVELEGRRAQEIAQRDLDPALRTDDATAGVI